MNSASRRDSINGRSGSVNASGRASVEAAGGSEPFERVGGTPVVAPGHQAGPAGAPGSMDLDFPLKPPVRNAIDGLKKKSPPAPPAMNLNEGSDFVLQQLQRQQQMDQQAYLPASIQSNPALEGGGGGMPPANGMAVQPQQATSMDLAHHNFQVQAPQADLGPKSSSPLASRSSPVDSNNGSNVRRSSSTASSGSNKSRGPTPLPAASTSNNASALGGLPSPGTLTQQQHRPPSVFQGKGSFPLNLTLMLESVESMGLSHIVSWMPNGQSFVIHDPDQFLSVVLPKFFKSSKNTKLRSFYRKLNRWGFSILRGTHQHHQISVAGLGGSLLATTTTKGVWKHPDFYRARAVECLRTALETGDAGCFLSVSHGQDKNGNKEEGSSGKKRRGSVPKSLTNSSSSGSSGPAELPSMFFGNHGQQQFQHRESDFSMGDDSALDSALNLDDFVLPQSGPLAGSYQQQPRAPQAAYANALNNSFTAGIPLAAQGQGTNMNKRNRRSIAHSTTGTNFNYQPITQSGRQGRQGVSASWTAGSTFAQHDFDFPSPFQVQGFGQLGENTNMAPNVPSGQGHQGGLHLQIGEPLPLNDNVDMLERLMGEQQQSQAQVPIQEGEEAAKELTAEDVELATFFEKFAESLQK